MSKRESLSDQLSRFNEDSENLRGVNFAIHKNVMIWGGTIIQLSNISSIAQYNDWENKKEEYYEKVEKSVSFKDFRDSNPMIRYAFIGAIACLIIGLFQTLFLIPFIGLAIWVAYSYYEHSKTIINVPKTKINRICHYMICITMNSTKRFDFEIETKEFRSEVMLALYQRIVEPGNNAGDIQIDLKNCNIVTDSVVNGGQVLLGDDNINEIEYADNAEA